ncbi:hypothetical protein [Legionella spiritensis]|uniref:Uncharacterized protein n=1 Tax=Legionella spiritensis TaxID=452 RepID=A0A0W0YYE9_LEGSP|nr:hypothetical protein [Legionella spiritensis]KTD61874.1 hypothetical protein Lspi_2504 [Legionella spiritensis]SNV45498.1 Uncharacterised protein [Legionella spiritensis]
MVIKILMGLGLLLSFVSSSGFANKMEAEQSVNAVVNHINQQLDACQISSKIIEGLSAEGSELKVCRNKQGIEKIWIQYMGEQGNAVESFYFDQNQLIYFQRDVTYYRGKEQAITEEKIYLKAGKIVSWYINGGVIPFDKATFHNRIKQLQQDIKLFKDKIRK